MIIKIIPISKTVLVLVSAKSFYNRDMETALSLVGELKWPMYDQPFQGSAKKSVGSKGSKNGLEP